MTRAEIAKLTEIRDGLKAAFWDFDKWRWAAKFDQFIRDAEHEAEGASKTDPTGKQPQGDNTPPLDDGVTFKDGGGGYIR